MKEGSQEGKLERMDWGSKSEEGEYNEKTGWQDQMKKVLINSQLTWNILVNEWIRVWTCFVLLATVNGEKVTLYFVLLMNYESLLCCDKFMELFLSFQNYREKHSTCSYSLHCIVPQCPPVEESNTQARRKAKLSNVLGSWWVQGYGPTESRGYFYLSLGLGTLLRLLSHHPPPKKNKMSQRALGFNSESHTCGFTLALHIPLLESDFNLHKINELWDDGYSFFWLWHPVLPGFPLWVGLSEPLCSWFVVFHCCHPLRMGHHL